MVQDFLHPQYHDVDAVSYLASLTCNDKARFISNIFPKKLIPAGVEDLRFHIKVRAVQGHSSLPRNYDPSALGELLDLKKRSDMGYIFHASSNANYDSIDAHGLVLSPFSHGIGHEKGLSVCWRCHTSSPWHFDSKGEGHSLLES